MDELQSANNEEDFCVDGIVDTGREALPYVENGSIDGLDIGAITGVVATVAGNPSGDKLSKSEKKAQKKEHKAQLRDQSKKIKTATKSVKKQLQDRDKLLSERTTEQRLARKSARNIVDYIGYNAMYRDGICEIETGLYSSSIAFADTSYHSVRDETKKGIFASLCRLYDQLGPSTLLQMNVINVPLRQDEIGSREFFSLEGKSGKVKEDSKLLNSVLNTKMKEGDSNINRYRLLTFSTAAPSADAAVPALKRIESESSRILTGIKSPTKTLSGEERLKALQSQIRPGKPFYFDFDRDVSPRLGMTTKDYIAPLNLDFKPFGHTDCFMTDGMWGQVLVMRDFGAELGDRVLSDIVDLPIALNVSCFAQPMDKAEAIKLVRQTSSFIDMEVIQEQRAAVNKGYDFSIMPHELKRSKEETEDLMDHLQNKNQRLFIFTGLIYTYAESKEKLDEQVLQIMDKARQNSVEIDVLAYQQREALNSILPLGHNHLDISRMFTTAQTAIFIPFATQDLNQPGGIYYGQNKYSGNLVIGNRRERLASPMGFICGKPGSGKSMFVKSEITQTVVQHPEDEIYIIDRAGEYTDIAKRYGGSVVDLAIDSETYLNPFDMVEADGGSFEKQLAFKIDAMLAQAAASAEQAGIMLSEVDQSIITRCVEIVFREAEERNKKCKKKCKCKNKNDCRAGKPPLLEDFYNVLKKQDDPEAKMIATKYERFATGVMSYFNNYSNVEWNRITDFNLKEIQEANLVFALINICEAIRNRMYANFAKGKRTWLYVEEIQSLFKYPTVLEYFSRFAAEGRKFGLILTGITQNSVALLRNEKAETIVLAADFLMLFKQSPVDRQRWVDFRNLSAQEEESIDDSAEPGDGLLLFGDARIPIRGNFPEDNDLYKLFSTNPTEAAEKIRAERLAKATAKAQAK